MTHICVGNQNIIGSDNGLSPCRRQAITWTNAEILFTGPFGTNFSDILIKIHTFLLNKMHGKMSSGKWRPFCLGLNVLRQFHSIHYTKGVSALAPLKHRNQLVTMGLTWIAFASKLFCRGVSDFKTDCLCGVWVRDLTTSPLYVGPLLRKSVLNTVVCMFDRRANSFSLPNIYIYW